VALLFLIMQLRHVRESSRGNRYFLRLAVSVILMLIPVMTAVSRLILGVHYPSDVVASLILNALLAASMGVITQQEIMAGPLH
jgi:undecaprenyl-diphosphatase